MGGRKAQKDRNEGKRKCFEGNYGTCNLCLTKNWTFRGIETLSS